MNRPNSSAPAQDFERYKTAFDNILSNYLRARLKPFGREHTLWKVFEGIAGDFRTYISIRPELKVKWSVGKGNWASVPWIAFLDQRETNSTQYGVYPVYLFREDLSGIYLALNHGISLLKQKHGTPESRRILRDRTAQLLLDVPTLDALKDAGFSLDNKIALHTSPGLEKNYEASTIAYKLYPRGKIPNDAELLGDLEQLLSVYDQYSEGQSLREPLSHLELVTQQPPHKDFQISAAIHELIAYIEDRGFVYEPWQIAQYITAVRTKPFVILAGITGSGKSKLPALVAEATGGVSKIIPVRPDWTDSAEVLGYTDLAGDFRAGPVLEIAHDAAANRDQFWTCIMDEMNLARVEHYFAEFLSIIEDRRPHEGGGYRTPPLLGQKLKETDAEWTEVGIPENLAIVGTVNMDESTQDFSRKVLDRAFTIELSEIDLARWRRSGRRVSNRALSTWPVTSWWPLGIRVFELLNPTDEQQSAIERVIDALDALNRVLAPVGLQVGYRTCDEIAFFVLHAQQIAGAFVDRQGNPVDPLDLALQMKILPRIVGDSPAIRRCVLGLLGWARTEIGPESEDDANAIVESWDSQGRPSCLKDSRYPRLAARLCLMWERLQDHQGTSYWS